MCTPASVRGTKAPVDRALKARAGPGPARAAAGSLRLRPRSHSRISLFSFSGWQESRLPLAGRSLSECGQACAAVRSCLILVHCGHGEHSGICCYQEVSKLQGPVP